LIYDDPGVQLTGIELRNGVGWVRHRENHPHPVQASEPRLAVPRSKTGLRLRSLLPAALAETATVLLLPYPYMVSFLKFHLKVGVEESIVNAPRITTDHRFKSNLTFCIVCVFTLETDEWSVHNQLFNAYFEAKFKKKHPIQYTYLLIQPFKCWLRDDTPESKLKSRQK
jgi:hypothetical protein